eukprot:GHVO01006144.1.p1 GENE.GHVO01006144.1~~GHVO01006144.1.p1  ORF type:complete len:705 (-),score=30.04 GHVO01006144.1:176-2290(-)
MIFLGHARKHMKSLFGSIPIILGSLLLGFAWFNATAARLDWAAILWFSALLTCGAKSKTSWCTLIVQAGIAAGASCALTVLAVAGGNDGKVNMSGFVQVSWEWAVFVGISVLSGYIAYLQSPYPLSAKGWRDLKDFTLARCWHAFWFFAGICLVLAIALIVTNEIMPSIPLLIVAGLSFNAAMCCRKVKPVLVVLIITSVAAIVLLAIRLAAVSQMILEPDVVPEGVTLPAITTTIAPVVTIESGDAMEGILFGSGFDGLPQPRVGDLGFSLPGKEFPNAPDIPRFLAKLSATGETIHRRLQYANWNSASRAQVQLILAAGILADFLYFIVTGTLVLHLSEVEGKRKLINIRPPKEWEPPMGAVATTESSRQTPHFQGTGSPHPLNTESPCAWRQETAEEPPATPPPIPVLEIPEPVEVAPCSMSAPCPDSILWSQDYEPVYIDLISPPGHQYLKCRVPTLIGTMKRETLYGTPGTHTRVASYATPPLTYEPEPQNQYIMSLLKSDPAQNAFSSLYPKKPEGSPIFSEGFISVNQSGYGVAKSADQIEDEFVNSISPKIPSASSRLFLSPIRYKGQNESQAHYGSERSGRESMDEDQLLSRLGLGNITASAPVRPMTATAASPPEFPGYGSLQRFQTLSPTGLSATAPEEMVTIRYEIRDRSSPEIKISEIEFPSEGQDIDGSSNLARFNHMFPNRRSSWGTDL